MDFLSGKADRRPAHTGNHAEVWQEFATTHDKKEHNFM